MSYAVADRSVTIGEFEAFMARQPHDTRWELVDGHILAMTNPSEDMGRSPPASGSACERLPGSEVAGSTSGAFGSRRRATRTVAWPPSPT